MDVRTKAQERNQDLEHGLHVKLSDDELVRQFTGKSLSEKLAIFYDTLINHSVILLKPGLTTQVTQHQEVTVDYFVRERQARFLTLYIT